MNATLSVPEIDTLRTYVETSNTKQAVVAVLLQRRDDNLNLTVGCHCHTARARMRPVQGLKRRHLRARIDGDFLAIDVDYDHDRIQLVCAKEVGREDALTAAGDALRSCAQPGDACQCQVEVGHLVTRAFSI